MSFNVWLTSYEQVKSFVTLAAKQPFDIHVGNERQSINGKDFMGMFTLDFTRPVSVHVNCAADECADFRQQVLALQHSIT